MILFIFLQLLSLNIQNNQEFIPYNKLENLTNKKLIEIYGNTKTNDVEKKILSIIQKRNFKKEEFNFKLSLSKRIEFVQNLNEESINLIKNNPYYFIPLSYLENSIFTDKDSKYLFEILQVALKKQKSIIIQRVFSLKKINKISFFNAIILMKQIQVNQKIFFTSALLDIEITIENKKKFKKTCLKNLYTIQNEDLLNNILYLLPKFFVFKDDDLIFIYNKLSKKNKEILINSLVVNNSIIPKSLIDIVDLSDNNLFLALLKYSDKNNQKIKNIESICSGRLIDQSELPYLNLYMNKALFTQISKNKSLFLKYLTNTIENNKKNEFLNKYSIKNYKNLKLDLYIRIELTKYIIYNKLITNDKVLEHIISLFKNKKLEYKSDEYYVSIILPLLAENYSKNDYKYYQELLKMLNRVAIESTLEAIKISNDKRFIKDLGILLKESEISDLVKKTILNLEHQEDLK